ncbi:MAG: hypothetical protein Q8P42_11805, partial [Gallionella sp.]|nr:hypothetical protein [Gallionella sp.]
AKYFVFYNGERPHQSLGNKTPEVVYRTAMGGGAMILDKYPRAVDEPPVTLRSTGGSSTTETRSDAETTTKTKATSKTDAKVKTGQRRPAASEVECAA